MFKKIIGKVCKNPECQFKDQIKEDYAVMCECGQSLEDVVVTNRKQIIIVGIIGFLVLVSGGYLGLAKLKFSMEKALVESGDKVAGSLTGKPGEHPQDKNTLTPADPKAAMLLVSDGLKLMKENKIEEAFEKFKMATEKDPNNDQGFGNLGAAYTVLEKHDEALTASLKAVFLNPSNPIWHLNAAELYSIKEQKDKALSELEEAIKNGFSDLKKLKSFNFKNIENEQKYKQITLKK